MSGVSGFVFVYVSVCVDEYPARAALNTYNDWPKFKVDTCAQ